MRLEEFPAIYVDVYWFSGRAKQLCLVPGASYLIGSVPGTVTISDEVIRELTEMSPKFEWYGVRADSYKKGLLIMAILK